VFDRWVVVRGDPGVLDDGTRQLFTGVEVGAHAFTGLTDDAPRARTHMTGREIVIERATLDNIMYYTGRAC
jgi:hypothetical protein